LETLGDVDYEGGEGEAGEEGVSVRVIRVSIPTILFDNKIKEKREANENNGRGRNTHSNIPTRIRSLRRRMGKIGSAFQPFHLSSPISHPTNPTQHPTATTSVTIIGTLPHAYLVPASSSAKTRRMEAASMRTTPMRSRRRKAVRVKRERKRLRRFSGWAPGSEGKKSEGRKKIINAVAAAPAGALLDSLATI
jgi:hypothetical protein